MKILALSTWFPYPPNNGSRIRAYYLLRALARRHRVTLVSFDAENDATPEVLDELGRQGIQTVAVPQDPYQHVARTPAAMRFLSPIPLSSRAIPEMQKTADRIARREDWDLVLAIQAPAARYAMGNRGIPRLVDVDTALSYAMQERYRTPGSWLSRVRRWTSWQKAHRYESQLFSQYQACTVASDLEVDYVGQLAKDCRVEVVPNGVDCEKNTLDLAPVTPETLVFNGALSYSANYDAMRYFLADIYPSIKRQLPNVSLTITGSLEGVDQSGLNLDESVHLSGYVEDIRPVVAGGAGCVVPLRQGGGTRLKILEAMALGTPVVSTRKGAEGLQVADGRDILLADDPATFASYTVRLLQDQHLQQRLAASARQLVEREYEWGVIGDRFVALVEETVKEHRAGCE